MLGKLRERNNTYMLFHNPANQLILWVHFTQNTVTPEVVAHLHHRREFDLWSIAPTEQNHLESEPAHDRNGSPWLFCHSLLILLPKENRLTKTRPLPLPHLFQKYNISSFLLLFLSFISFFPSIFFLTETLRFDSEEGKDSDLQSDSKAKDSNLVPLFHNHTLSKVIYLFIGISNNW